MTDHSTTEADCVKRHRNMIVWVAQVREVMAYQFGEVLIDSRYLTIILAQIFAITVRADGFEFTAIS